MHYDARTALCVELETERGSLLVYGTIIGIFGNRHPNFKQDLVEQVKDFKRLAGFGKTAMCHRRLQSELCGQLVLHRLRAGDSTGIIP